MTTQTAALNFAIEFAEFCLEELDLSYMASNQAKRLVEKAKEALAQPEHTSEYKRGYADAMNWKMQNHLEHLPAAQPAVSETHKQEPVAWFTATPIEGNGNRVLYEQVSKQYNGTPDTIPLYTTPPTQQSCSQRTAAKGEDTRRAWVGLTEKEIRDFVIYPMNPTSDLVRLVEMRLKEKNT